ncbi:unnamed protein product [Orchesella dallaii]|uniref:Uncharacterized protein n=1 Tax=Orchesella dallaii TaxID=48710 RepID=A0ABP1RH09_9HEXA
MRTLLVLVSVFGAAFAGVGILTPREEAEVLQLYRTHCGGWGSSGQEHGWGSIHCKRSPEELTQTAHYNVRVPGSSGGAQTIFVQPPAVRYNHRVQIQGSGGAGSQTKVYVLPQKATHQLTSDFRPGQNGEAKTQVFFLKGDNSNSVSGGSGGGGYGAPANQSPPQGNYGPPPNQTPQNYGPPNNQPPQSYRTLLQNFGPPPQNYGPPPAQGGWGK